MTHITRFVKEESGSTAIEYGMLCSLCIITILAAVTQFADATSSLWTTVANHV